MAWVIIGGLLSSLLLTLLLVPSTYLVVDQLLDRFSKKKGTPKDPHELNVAKELA